jgi:2-polyprenyl-3-methyl-5-hydroxy-6-metoxy-1,4-benzoquinol methylase
MSSWPGRNHGAPPFDGLLCAEILEHLTPGDGLDLLTRAAKLCKPGAMLCVTVPIEGGTRAVYPGHISSFSQADLCALIDQAGFTRTDIDWLPHDTEWDCVQPIWLMVTARA